MGSVKGPRPALSRTMLEAGENPRPAFVPRTGERQAGYVPRQAPAHLVVRVRGRKREEKRRREGAAVAQASPPTQTYWERRSITSAHVLPPVVCCQNKRHAHPMMAPVAYHGGIAPLVGSVPRLEVSRLLEWRRCTGATVVGKRAL